MYTSLLLCASTAGAQATSTEMERTLLIETELLGGYTGVSVEKWANAPHSSSDKASFGVNVRAYLFLIGRTRVGLELGTQHLFTWNQDFTVGSTRFLRTFNVGGPHFGFVVRACDASRFDCEVGYSFHFVGESSLPGAHFGMNYILWKSKRFRLPIGARMDLLLADRAMALPLVFKTGLTF